MALLWGAALPCTGDIPRTASLHFGGTLMPFLILLTLIRIGHVVSRARPSGFTDRQCDARGFLVLVSRREREEGWGWVGGVNEITNRPGNNSR